MARVSPRYRLRGKVSSGTLTAFNQLGTVSSRGNEDRAAPPFFSVDIETGAVTLDERARIWPKYFEDQDKRNGVIPLGR